MTKVDLDKLDELYETLELSSNPAHYSDFHNFYPALRDEILELRAVDTPAYIAKIEELKRQIAELKAELRVQAEVAKKP